jgi:hypothetical protein
MNVYAIHRDNIFTTDYNVMICSSKKVAESKIKTANEAYYKWYEAKKTFADYSIKHLDFIYNNPMPSKYRFEKIQITCK